MKAAALMTSGVGLSHTPQWYWSVVLVSSGTFYDRLVLVATRPNNIARI